MLDLPTPASCPACTCKWCGREFTYVFGFTPGRDVCYFCGPLDVRRQAEAAASGSPAEPHPSK